MRSSVLWLAFVAAVSLTFGHLSAGETPESPLVEEVRTRTAGHDLEKSTSHPDGTVEETYRDADGGTIRVVYRPDGRVDYFGAPAYEPPVHLPSHLAPLGAELTRETTLSAAARRTYAEAASYLAPTSKLAIVVTLETPSSFDDLVDQPLSRTFTHNPERVLEIVAGTTHFSTNGEYLDSRTIIKGSWIESPKVDLVPEIETLADYLSLLRSLGHRIADYAIVEALPMTIDATFEEQSIEYQALAFRLEADDSQRLFMLDEVLGALVLEAQEQVAPPLSPADYLNFPGSEEFLREQGLPEPKADLDLGPIDHVEPPNDGPDPCCNPGTRIFRYPDVTEYDQTAHSGGDGLHKAKVTWKLYCNCTVECEQTATTTIETSRADSTFCQELGFVSPWVHTMKSDYDGMTTNAWDAVTYSSSARADAGFICGMKQCLLGICTSGIRLGVTAPPVNGAAIFDTGDTLWHYKRAAGLTCPPCERHTTVRPAGTHSG